MARAGAERCAAPYSVWAENLPIVGSGLRDVRYIFLSRMRDTVRELHAGSCLRARAAQRERKATLRGRYVLALSASARRLRCSRSWWAP